MQLVRKFNLWRLIVSSVLCSPVRFHGELHTRSCYPVLLNLYEVISLCDSPWRYISILGPHSSSSPRPASPNSSYLTRLRPVSSTWHLRHTLPSRMHLNTSPHLAIAFMIRPRHLNRNNTISLRISSASHAYTLSRLGLPENLRSPSAIFCKLRVVVLSKTIDPTAMNDHLSLVVIGLSLPSVFPWS